MAVVGIALLPTGPLNRTRDGLRETRLERAQQHVTGG